MLAFSTRRRVRSGQRFDVFYGGLSGAPKFPSTGLIELLWRAHLRTGVPQFLQLALTTLDHMALGGIYDHVGGGFARYSTDERWLVPHFEKMLYDNAQLIDLYILSWQHNRSPLYRARVEETVGWLLREMMVEQAFAASLDADQDGEEGKYYLWSEAEIDAALMGTFVQRFKQALWRAARGQFRRPQHSAAAGRRLSASRSRRGVAQENSASFCWRRVKSGKPRSATTRCSPTGTAWRLPRLPLQAWSFATANGPRRRSRPSSSWTIRSATATGFIIPGATARAITPVCRRLRTNGARGALALWEATGDKRFLVRAQSLGQCAQRTFLGCAERRLFLHGRRFRSADRANARRLRPGHAERQRRDGRGVVAPSTSQPADNAHRDRANALIQAFAGRSAARLFSRWAPI